MLTAKEGLFKAAGIVAAVSVVSKILGFFREASLAAIFGATYVTDAYQVGQTIPTLIFASVGAALGTTYIPVFSQVRQEQGQEAAHNMASSVINATVILSLLCIVIGELLAGPLVKVIAPGFAGSGYELTVNLSRIMFPMVLFQALSGLMTGMLQTEGNFTVPALVTLAFNTVIISTIVGLGPTYGIRAVALGTVVAIALQAVLQIPAMRRMGYKWKPVLDLHDAGLRRMGKLVVPVLLATLVTQLGTVVNRILASGLDEGSISVLNYANRLMGLVPGVLGVAITTVMYPTLAQLAAKKEWQRFSRAFVEAVKMINFVMIPVAVGMAVLRVPLVQIVFERGVFDTAATEATAWTLLFFCLGVAVFSLQDMLNRTFFAFQDTKAPMLIGMVSVGINIVLNLLLVGPLKQAGLALASSLAWMFAVVILLWYLRQRVKELGSIGIGGMAIVSSLWRVLVASGVMAVIVWFVHESMLVRWPGMGLLWQGLRLIGAVGAGVVSYAVVAWVLQVPEVRVVWRTLVQVGRRMVGKARGLAGA